MEENTKRPRGAPRGNRNALKHGYYSRAFKKAERPDFYDAAGIEGLDEEIALFRRELKKAVSGGDDRNLKLLEKAALSLGKLIRTRYEIKDTRHHQLNDAISNVVRDVLKPLGVDIGNASVHRNTPDKMT